MSLTFPDFGRFTQAVLTLAVPVTIGFLPILLHLIDKGMEKFSPFREEVIRELMAADKRPPIANVGKSEPLFRGVRTYFDYERKVHLVIALAVFNIVSLYVAQTECTRSLLQFTAITLIGIIALTVFLITFLWKVADHTFDPASVDPTKRWQAICVIAFLIVLALEVALHVTC